VLVFPDWTRVSRTLADHGFAVAPERLAAADVHARFTIDRAEVLGAIRVPDTRRDGSEMKFDEVYRREERR
jgi:hypothetical protein